MYRIYTMHAVKATTAGCSPFAMFKTADSTFGGSNIMGRLPRAVVATLPASLLLALI
jgi:hypothetical protein